MKTESSLGVTIFVGRKYRVLFRDILDVWLFEYNGPVTIEQATTQEVAQTAWITKAQIQQLLDQERLVQTLSYLFETEKL